VLGEILPEIRDEINDFGPNALREMAASSTPTDSLETLRRQALVRFGEMLFESTGTDIDQSFRSNLERAATTALPLMGGTLDNRRAFAIVCDQVSADTGRNFTSEECAQMRSSAMQAFGLLTPVALPVRAPESLDTSSMRRNHERFIDAEIVAIYW
jgi:hypothetical protein